MPSLHKDKRDFEVKSRTFFATYLGEIQPLAFHVNIFWENIAGQRMEITFRYLLVTRTSECGLGYYILRA